MSRRGYASLQLNPSPQSFAPLREERSASCHFSPRPASGRGAGGEGLSSARNSLRNRFALAQHVEPGDTYDPITGAGEECIARLTALFSGLVEMLGPIDFED
jgi:hypothetical protein